MTENNHADAPQPERPAEFPMQSGQPASQTPWSDRTSEAASSSPAQPPSGPYAMQIVRTYPAHRRPFPFAPDGERSIARAYLHAFSRARRTVYFED